MRDLDAFIDARRAQSFEYFSRDCAHLAADWVLTKTGKDPLEPLRADGGPLAPRKLLPALRFIHANGGFVGAATTLLGEPVPGLMARRGDVVLVRNGAPIRRVSGYSFGVCTGPHIVAPGQTKLLFLPLTDVEAAWRV
jgi:hypothetical protein